MRKTKLTKDEKNIEHALLRGEYLNVDKNMCNHVAKAIAARKKDKAISIRLNGTDLELIKRKAKMLGVKYQTFVAELVHQVAHS